MSDSSKQIDPSLSNRQLLSKWLNKTLKVQITDGRTLIGIFLCTDKNSNIVLGSCKEYTSLEQSDPRSIGLSMIPGHHIISIFIDEPLEK